MKSLKNSAIKSLIYILIFAGLLKLSSLILTWVWNKYIVHYYGVEPITFLESTGMIAFMYLIYAGVKFGFDSLSTLSIFPSKDKFSKDSHIELTSKNDFEESFKLQCKFMNKEEKEKLKETLAKYCGVSHAQENNYNSPNIHIQHINSKKIK